MAYRQCYTPDLVSIYGIVTDADDRHWLLFNPLQESPFYCPGIGLEISGEDCRVTILRVSIDDGEKWTPGADQHSAQFLHYGIEKLIPGATPPGGLKPRQRVMAALLPFRPRRLILTCAGIEKPALEG